jgi:general secretion pathway protein D
MRMQRVWVAVACAVLPVFVGAAEESAVRGATPPQDNGRTIDLVELIGKVAKRTGRQFVLDPRIAGRATMAGLEPDRVDYDTLLAILRVHNMVVFTQGGVVNVVSDAEARQLPIPTFSGDDSKMAGDELVTRLVQARNVCVAHLVPVLRPMLPQYAHMAAYPYTNTIILVDRGANVRRIADVIERLDRSAPGKQSCDGPSKSGG